MKEPKNLSYSFGKFVGGTYCRLSTRMKVEGQENIPTEGGFLLISNHQSFLDPLFCGVPCKRQLHFLARDTLFKGFFGKMITSFGAIPVKRGQSDVKTMKAIIQKLKESRAVCLFPEGTRCKDGKIADLKSGFGLLSRRGKVPIVPAVIEGAHEVWPRHQKLPSLFKEVRIKYGQPISLEEVKEIKDQQLAEKVTYQLRQMQNELRQKMGRNIFNYYR